MVFSEQEVEQVCGGFFRKQKLSVFELAQDLGTKYLDFQIDFAESQGFKRDPNDTDDGMLRFLLTDHLKRKITPEATGIPAFILWWIVSYIINYVVEKLMKEYLSKKE